MKETMESFKSKIEDFASPFMSSLIISWIILNHKYILIYFGNGKFENKIKVLNEYSFSIINTPWFNWDIPYTWNVLVPILFALFYVYIYPWFSHKFYSTTMVNKATKEGIKYSKYEKALHNDKQELQEKIILKEQKINEYKKLLMDIEENNKKENDKELTKLKNENTSEVMEIKGNNSKEVKGLKESHSTEIQRLKSNHSKEIKELKESHSTELEKIKENNSKEINNREKAYMQQMGNKNQKELLAEENFLKIIKKVKISKNEILSNLNNDSDKLKELIKNKELLPIKNDKYIIVHNTNQSYDEIKVLQFIYNQGLLDRFSLDSMMDKIKINLGKSVYQINHIFNKLIEKKVVNQVNKGILQVTDKTVSILVTLFDE